MDTKSQQLLLNGCVVGFAVMFITVGLMTVARVENLGIATTEMTELTALCFYKRVTHSL